MMSEIAGAAPGNFGGVGPTIGRLRKLLICKTQCSCVSSGLPVYAGQPTAGTACVHLTGLAKMQPVIFMPARDTRGRVEVSLRTQSTLYH